jgi:hypothetical protein
MKDIKTSVAKNLLIIGLLLVILYLVTCKRKVVQPEPVKSVAQQALIVKTDSIASKKYNDSVLLKVKQSAKDAEMWYNEWKASETRYNDLEKGIAEFTQKPVPDSCKELQKEYSAQLLKMAKANSQKDISCENTIRLKSTTIEQQAVLIKSKNNEIGKLRASVDTAFAQQTKLTRALKQLKPKNSIYIGATALGNESKFINGYGVNLGFRNKKGTMWEVGALQIGSTINYTIGFKKTLFNF